MDNTERRHLARAKVPGILAAGLALALTSCSNGGGQAPPLVTVDYTQKFDLDANANANSPLTLRTDDGSTLVRIPPEGLPAQAKQLTVKIYNTEQRLIDDVGGVPATTPVDQGGLGERAVFLGAFDLSLRDADDNGLNFRRPVRLELALGSAYRGGRVLIGQGFDPSTTFANRTSRMFTRFVAYAEVVERTDPDGTTRKFVVIDAGGFNVPVTQAYGSPPGCCYQVDPGAPVVGSVNEPPCDKFDKGVHERFWEAHTKFQVAAGDIREKLAEARGMLRALDNFHSSLLSGAIKLSNVGADLLTFLAKDPRARLLGFLGLSETVSGLLESKNAFDKTHDEIEELVAEATALHQDLRLQLARVKLFGSRIPKECLGDTVKKWLERDEIWAKELKERFDAIRDSDTYDELGQQLQAASNVLSTMQQLLETRRGEDFLAQVNSLLGYLGRGSESAGDIGQALKQLASDLDDVLARATTQTSDMRARTKATVPPAEGYLVRIQGQSYFSAFTDADGRFILPPIPPNQDYSIVLLDPETEEVLDIKSGKGVGENEESPFHQFFRKDSGGDLSAREFTLAFLPNLDIYPQSLQLRITSDLETEGFIEAPRLQRSVPFKIEPGGCVTVPLDAYIREFVGATDDGTLDNGLRIRANDPIKAYAFSLKRYTSDAFAVHPTATLGRDYRVMGYTPDTKVKDRFQLAVVAVQDDTTLTITLTEDSGERKKGIPFTVELDAYQTYQLRSPNDLVGSRVTADKPVAVLSGNRCNYVPNETPACDHLVSQMPPVDAWGREIATVPLASRQRGDSFRILASVNGTKVTISGSSQRTLELDAGQAATLVLEGANLIRADQPILVAQYSNGSRHDQQVGDPFQMVLPPTDRFLRGYRFVSGGPAFVRNYLNIVARTTDARSGRVLLDGEPIPWSSFQPVPDSGLVWMQATVDAGCHRVESPSPVGLSAYGFGNWDSYGYVGGLVLPAR